MQDVKDQATPGRRLRRCCARCCRQQRDRLRLVIVGDGPLLRDAARAGRRGRHRRRASGCPARATTSPTSCAGFRRVRAVLDRRRHARSRCSKRWPAACRWWRPRVGGIPEAGRRRRHRRAGAAVATRRRWPQRWRAMCDDAGAGARAWRRRARAHRTQIQHGGDGRRLHGAVRHAVRTQDQTQRSQSNHVRNSRTCLTRAAAREIDRAAAPAHERDPVPPRPGRRRRCTSSLASGFGHRRLSIIDLSSRPAAAVQRRPAAWSSCSTARSTTIRELTDELTALGHTFRTRCDTEVIVHALGSSGARTACTRLRGMFAFAIWDRNKQTLFMARDRLGVKPLHYALLPDGMLVFGSELKSLLSLARPAARDRPARGRGLFRLRLRAGAAHHLQGRAQAGARPHADAAASAQPRAAAGQVLGRAVQAARADGAKREMEQELIARLREAVAEPAGGRRAAGRLPVGRRRFERGGGDDGRPDRASRSTPARSPSTTRPSTNRHTPTRWREQYKTDHQRETVDTDDYGLLDTLAGLYDEPYADSSAIPTYRVCQLARKRVTVALSGDGGDENFAGYRRYRYGDGRAAACARCCRSALRKPVFGFARHSAIRRPTGRRACSAPRPPSKRWRATWSKATSTACRSCPTACATQLFSDKFRSRPAGLPRDRSHARPRSERADRRSAVDDPVPRHEDLPAGRHPDQGRPRQHGARARSAGAAAGPQVRRMGLRPAVDREAAAAAKASTSSRRRSSPTCRTTSCTARRWASRFRWRLAARPAARQRCATPCSIRRCSTPASSTSTS